MEVKITSAEQAEKDLEAARDSLRALMDGIISGDGTEADLEAAERRVRYCEARLEGARRREEEETEEERLRVLENLAERTREQVAAADVEKARKAAERALDRYVEACVAHNAALDEAAVELLGAGDLPEGYGVATGSDGHSPTLAGKAYRRVRPMVEVRDMGLEVLGRHWRGGYISLGDDAY